MSHILLLDGGTNFGHSKGELNHTLTAIAQQTLTALGHHVTTTAIAESYDIDQEVAHFAACDTVIVQMPGWWMGEPWTVKKYMDEVFTQGYGTLYSSDGRSRENSEKKYGSGGLLQGKHYLLSLTWNAPLEAFTDPQQFFEGVGIDGLYLHTHKAFQFLGMSPRPTFICNDVIKRPDVTAYSEAYQRHLTDVFGQS